MSESERQTPPPAVPSDNPTGALFLDLATVVLLVAAVVYVAGWTYAYHYFGHFGLGLLTLEIPLEYFFMYGFWVFKAWWWLVLAYGLLVSPILLHEPRLLPLRSLLRQERPFLLKHLQGILVLLAFVLAWALAVGWAGSFYREQQAAGFTAYPHVRVWPKESPEDVKLKAFYEALPTGIYQLLLQNRDTLFLIKVPRGGERSRVGAVNVLALSEVRALRVLN